MFENYYLLEWNLKILYENIIALKFTLSKHNMTFIIMYENQSKGILNILHIYPFVSVFKS